MSEMKDFFDSPIYSLVDHPPGSVLMLPFLPTNAQIPGYLVCIGSMLPAWHATTGVHTGYYPLWQAIGTEYGTNGSNGFRIPDYRGYFLRGRDKAGTNDPDHSVRLDKVGSTQTHNIKSHNHGASVDANNVSSEAGPGWYDLNTADAWNNHIYGSSYRYPSIASGIADTRPKNYSMVFIIKY